MSWLVAVEVPVVERSGPLEQVVAPVEFLRCSLVPVEHKEQQEQTVRRIEMEQVLGR